MFQLETIPIICRRPVAFAALFAMLLAPSSKSLGAEGSLTILNGTVQKAEDSPAVSPSYQFLSGDFLYFSFRLAGFKIRTQSEGNSESRSISLSYEATPLDEHNVPLCVSATGSIDTELNAEDKDWTPNREVSFLLPSFLAAGSYHVRLKVRDKFAEVETTRDFAFRVGGPQILAVSNLNVQNFGFLRKENDREALEVPAYAPGDTVFVRFDMVGFKVAENNSYRLAYGVTVLRPDGKAFLNDPKAAELSQSTFYPVAYVPGVLQISAPSSAARGQYILILRVRDLLAGSEYETKRAFSIE